MGAENNWGAVPGSWRVTVSWRGEDSSRLLFCLHEKAAKGKAWSPRQPCVSRGETHGGGRRSHRPGKASSYLSLVTPETNGQLASKALHLTPPHVSRGTSFLSTCTACARPSRGSSIAGFPRGSSFAREGIRSLQEDGLIFNSFIPTNPVSCLNSMDLADDGK